jgi:predicted amidophosphoribosyltransferase
VAAFADIRWDSCRCRRCDADLTRLTGAARFCYHCGTPLEEYQRKGNRMLPVLSRLDELFSTTIVRGYAHAMFRLGTRYEVRRNDREAARCYGKATRLGSEAARARLVRLPDLDRHDGCMTADS